MCSSPAVISLSVSSLRLFSTLTEQSSRYLWSLMTFLTCRQTRRPFYVRKSSPTHPRHPVPTSSHRAAHSPCIHHHCFTTSFTSGLQYSIDVHNNSYGRIDRVLWYTLSQRGDSPFVYIGIVQVGQHRSHTFVKIRISVAIGTQSGIQFHKTYCQNMGVLQKGLKPDNGVRQDIMIGT